MTEGIYVKSVTPKGPADECGNILVGMYIDTSLSI